MNRVCPNCLGFSPTLLPGYGVCIRPNKHLLQHEKSRCKENRTRTKAFEDSPLPINWKPTGVPLLERLRGLETIQQANTHAVHLIVLALVGSYVISRIFNYLSSKVCWTVCQHRLKRCFSCLTHSCMALQALPAEEEGLHEQSLLQSVIGAIAKPVTVLLPYLGMIYSATVVSAMSLVYSSVHEVSFEQFCSAYLNYFPSIVACSW